MKKLAELLAVMRKWEKATMMFMLGFQVSLGEMSRNKLIDWLIYQKIKKSCPDCWQ
jgi:hypothetical protein